jgi:hypothetical protein
MTLNYTNANVDFVTCKHLFGTVNQQIYSQFFPRTYMQYFYMEYVTAHVLSCMWMPPASSPQLSLLSLCKEKITTVLETPDHTILKLLC